MLLLSIEEITITYEREEKIKYNNHMHSDSKKRRSSFLVALLFAAGDVRRYA